MDTLTKWFAYIYGKIFLGHPSLFYAVVVLVMAGLAGVVGLLLSTAAVDKYRQEHPESPVQTPPPRAISESTRQSTAEAKNGEGHHNSPKGVQPEVSRVAEDKIPPQQLPNKSASLPQSVTVKSGGVASFGQQGGITAGQVNVFTTEDQSPLTLEISQRVEPGGPPYKTSVTIKPSRSLHTPNFALFFDREVQLISSHTPGGMRVNAGEGTLNDSTGKPDDKTVWIFWSYPPLDGPMSVTVASDTTPAKLLKVGRGPKSPLDN